MSPHGPRHLPTADYSIRPATAGDLDRLVELFLTLQEHVEKSNTDLWRMTEEAREHIRGQLGARLEAIGSCAQVAEHARDGVIGMAFARIVTNHRYQPSRTGIVDQAFVRADHRRRGVGGRLVGGLAVFFRDQAVEDISLRYAAGNREAEAFWAALGFEPRIVTAGAHCGVLEGRLNEAEVAGEIVHDR